MHALKQKPALLAIGFIFCFLIFNQYRPDSASRQRLQLDGDPGAGPTFTTIQGRQVAWELPAAGPPRAVVFFAHGCHHACLDLWPPSKKCPTCLGLPEEMRVRKIILQQGYAVLGMSSMERVKGCWSEIREDKGEGVARLIEQVLADLKLQKLPLYALGASSGGTLALLLPSHLKVAGVVAEVRGVATEELQLSGGRKYPPTVFIHMPRDEENLIQIREDIEFLRSQRVPVAELKIAPRAITAEFLAERSPHITPRMAKDIVNALREGGFIDEAGELYEPPRPTLPLWGPLVQPVVGNLTLELDKSQVTELLNLAWAKHEIVSDHLDTALRWLAAGGSGSI